ncbi:KTSC domain-containing protein [Luteimonas fraxinea]|uniref:KTSC domain-containing protein n=1 Tax=Luteimonas fraxinea TaxID=2901869 RepID=A0ABS8UBA4_9GAMM|nr:KTSC domain-containing protein [Luteimonas fraxinea]MCD9096152.1 KTSC domain-containing protein [Luteimonas fraxinea]
MTQRIALIDVDSSQIHSIGHDPETNTLAIRFTKGYRENRGPGALYHYANVDAEAFAALRDAESIGKHFGQHIKPFQLRHPYTRIDEPASGAETLGA